MPHYSVDIDVGGTMTDGFFSDYKSFTRIKVDTTPHDLTLCFINCLEEGAKKFGFPNLPAFLECVDIIRWSTTVASNVLAQRVGSRLGLLITKGFSKNLYLPIKKSPALGYLVSEENIKELSEDPSDAEITEAIRSLLESGVRRIVVSLKGSFYDPKQELKSKSVINYQYADHYLGHVPTLLGSDICKHPDDATRTHYALLNAYVHAPLAMTLYKAEDELFSRGYYKPLLIGNISGGAVRVAKTRAIDTIESGPVFGIFGSAFFAKTYGLGKVITMDIGGTTTKIGVVERGEALTFREPLVFDIPIKIPLVLPLSIGLGGSSVVKVDEAKKLTVGPESVGAYPGPACYDLGGTEPTVTDANVLLGFINPNYFLGGTKKLNAERAKQVVSDRVASPLRVDVNEAAMKIFGEACAMVASLIKKQMDKLNFKPGECSLFAFGGNGPVLGCTIAEKVGINRVYVFSISSVFSTFGSHQADIIHSYEYSLKLPLLPKADQQTFNKVVSSMREEALRDMFGEGLDPGKITLSLELDVGDGKNPPIRISTDYFLLKDESDIKRIFKVYDEAAPSNYDRKTVVILLIKLKAIYATKKCALQENPKGKKEPKAALKGKRTVCWDGKTITTDIYEWDLLKCGNVVEGPAIVEGADTTYVIPKGWSMEVDKYLNGLIRRV